MTLFLAYWLLAAPPLTLLAVVLLNLRFWPRGRPDGRIPGRVSVLIPARNEAANIERCVRSVLRSTYLPDEVIVYDDGSTDATPQILVDLAAADPRVRVLTGGSLPSGWVGKPHACHRLAEAASGNVLVFVDADTLVRPDGLARLGSVLADYTADVVTVGVRQVTRSFAERLIIPLLHLSYVAWLLLPLVWRTRDPRLLVASGQVIAVRRAAYRALGGWAAVRGEVVDDMAFCRAAKTAGLRVVFADGHHIATSRMYRNFRQVWEGFSKNLYEGVGGRPAGLAAVLALHAWVFLLPYAALLAALLGTGTLLLPALLGVGANLLVRTAIALRFGQPPEGVVLHPLAIVVLLALALNSLRWARRGEIRWRGRVYAARESRIAPEPQTL
jgi:chlorobactene glucosyltransferase